MPDENPLLDPCAIWHLDTIRLRGLIDCSKEQLIDILELISNHNKKCYHETQKLHDAIQKIIEKCEESRKKK